MAKSTWPLIDPAKALLSRREMLRLAATGPVLGAGFASLLSTTRDAQAMLYIPKQERLWDTWMLYHHGTFYLFHLSLEASRPADPAWDGYSLATSSDGIHWKEQGCVYRGDGLKAEHPEYYGGQQ